MKHSATNKRSTSPRDLEVEISQIGELSITQLRQEWRTVMGGDAPPGLTKDLLARALAYRLQEDVFGGLSALAKKALRDHAKPAKAPRQVKAGSIIVREYRGVLHEVLVVPDGFCWRGKTFGSLSVIAKKISGTNWNGPRFFGLRAKRGVLVEPEGADRNDALARSSDGQARDNRRSSVKAAPERPSSRVAARKPHPGAGRRSDDQGFRTASARPHEPSP